jgi:L-ascorbate metabolism protein UlaG (beta-lactamase superfamily)
MEAPLARSHARLTWSPAPLPTDRAAARPGAAVSARAGVTLHWLGQAGFLLESASLRILIDPYLSDSLAIKYKGAAHPHVRMCPSPADPAALRGIDIVLATHGHTDHLDPATIGPIAAANPDCLFVVPASCVDKALERGVPRGRLVEANAFAALDVAGLAVHPIPAAHEELAIDDRGRLVCLGYVLELGGVLVYHPGDCAPYPGFADNLAPYAVDLALLPVNGRDAVRAASGVPGNFSLEEAVGLTESAGFGAAIGHHFGMFDFNTIDEAHARRFLAGRDGRASQPPFLLADPGLRYEVTP